MIALLDVNVLVALAWPNHVHHQAAHSWFREQRERGWATCPVTESGFVRVSSNPATTPEARTPREALELLDLMVAASGHVFWHDDVSLATEQTVFRERLVGHRQVTDAHLLSLAMRRGGRLATFDRGILQLVPQGYSAGEVVDLIG